MPRFFFSALIFSAVLTFSACKECKECRECAFNGTTGVYDQNCSEYEEFCDAELDLREEQDIFDCK